MFGISAVLAALAMTGAPNTPVRCNPGLTPGQEGATRYADTASRAYLVELSAEPCAGIILLAASPTERVRIAALNPGVNFSAREGLAAIVVLLEAVHTTHTYQADETDDLCRAATLVPTLLGKYLSGADLATAVGWANFYDSILSPATYHTHGCSG